MATGDVLGASVHSSGLYIEVEFENMSSGGNYDYNLSANNDPVTNNFKVDLTRESFDGVGVPTTIAWVLYSGYRKRQFSPNDSLADETVNGSNVIVRMYLSKQIYAGDSNITIDVGAGLYNDGTNDNNAATSYPVTNNSTLGYFQTTGHFSRGYHGRRIGFDEVTLQETSSSTYQVRVKAFGNDFKDGQPVRVVKITMSGQTSLHSQSVFVTAPTIDPENKYKDAIPFAEYIGEIPIAGFTQGEKVDLNFIAYPWVGDATNILDTSAVVGTMPSTRPVTQTVLCDKDHTYGTSIAVVNTTGDDGTGVVVDYSSFDDQTPPAAFLTVGGALNAIRSYNNTNRTRDDHGGGIVYVQTGSYTWVGVGVTQTDPDTYATVALYPGLSRGDVSFTSQGGDNDFSDYAMMHTLEFDMSSGNIMSGPRFAWYFDCLFTQGATTHQYTDNAAAFISGGYGHLSQGLRGFSARNTTHHVTGFEWDSTVEDACAHFMAGVKVNSGRLGCNTKISGSNLPRIDGGILSDCKFCVNDDGRAINFYGKTEGDATVGFVVSNVLIEQSHPAPSAPLVWIAGDDTTYTVDSHSEASNVLLIHLGVLGGRTNAAYNDIALNGQGSAARNGWVIHNCYFDDFNCVTDKDAHGGVAAEPPPIGARSGNHALIHGCGISGFTDLGRVGAATSYYPEFLGIKGQRGVDLDPGFVDDQSSIDGGGGGGGNGDYNLLESSILKHFGYSKAITYDLEGRQYLDTPSVGPYEVVSAISSAILRRRRDE